jgi:hypothetical protein
MRRKPACDSLCDGSPLPSLCNSGPSAAFVPKTVEFIMSERSWPTMTAGGLCHLVAVDCTSQEAADMADVLDVVCTAGNYAIDSGGGQFSVAFTSFADAERFTGAMRDVRPVRQLETRWSSEWFGVFDAAAMRRQLQEIRWTRRAARHGAAASVAAPSR